MTNKKLTFYTVREKLFWSYANLAMAHSAVFKKQKNYTKFNFMIRSRLFNGLLKGTMNVRTIFDDEKIKIKSGQICNYCGSHNGLALDHIFPKRFGGKDNADNLILACKACNSSKGKKDLMEWMIYRDDFLPLMIIRRYLKLTFNYCVNNDLMDKSLNEINELELPFKINYLPISFPEPEHLKLNTDELSD